LSRKAIATLLLLSALVGCPKPQPPVEQPTPEPTPSRPAGLSIRGIEPSSTTAGRAVTVTIRGEAFLEGADVYLGSRKPLGVDVLSAREITFRVDEGVAVGRYDVRVQNPDGEQAVLPGAFSVLAESAGGCTLAPISFDYDQAVLSGPMRDAISANKRCMEQKKVARVRLEGHADERGETEYNLALGQRRADAVRTYLVNLGFPPKSAVTVSYGEERPADAGHDEGAWARNRRVEFVAN
jgi:peptidoglycan-associated lipoprotein